MGAVFAVDACRTPAGKIKGALAGVRPDHLPGVLPGLQPRLHPRERRLHQPSSSARFRRASPAHKLTAAAAFGFAVFTNA